jgi:divalent metal cation (Fe/Co/Zn/Cd) transporter
MKLRRSIAAIVVGVFATAAGALVVRLAFSHLTTNDAVAIAVGLGVAAAWGAVSLGEHWLRNQTRDDPR